MSSTARKRRYSVEHTIKDLLDPEKREERKRKKEVETAQSDYEKDLGL